MPSVRINTKIFGCCIAGPNCPPDLTTWVPSTTLSRYCFTRYLEPDGGAWRPPARDGDRSWRREGDRDMDKERGGWNREPDRAWGRDREREPERERDGGRSWGRDDRGDRGGWGRDSDRDRDRGGFSRDRDMDRDRDGGRSEKNPPNFTATPKPKL